MTASVTEKRSLWIISRNIFPTATKFQLVYLVIEWYLLYNAEYFIPRATLVLLYIASTSTYIASTSTYQMSNAGLATHANSTRRLHAKCKQDIFIRLFGSANQSKICWPLTFENIVKKNYSCKANAFLQSIFNTHYVPV